MTSAVSPDAVNGMQLDTIADVLSYLDECGWKVTKTSLYRHGQEGKILPRVDGTYDQKVVDKYAKIFLRQKSTGKKINEAMDELQRKKLEREIEIEDLEYERKKFLHEKDLGKFIPKDQMEIELAGRAGILEAGLKHWIQSRGADWIRTVDGDIKKVGDLINLMNRDLDEHINSYASKRDYEIVIDAGEEESE